MYGTREHPDLIDIMNELKTLFANHTPDDIIADANCEGYFEEKKALKTKRVGSTKSTHLADIIMKKILETEVNSAQEWENVIPPDFKLQLIKEFGLTVDSYIQKIIRIVKTEKISQNKQKTFT